MKDWQQIELTHEEYMRYSRHLIMPEVGMKGQRKLKASSILLIGAGGLGSPLGMYLAAAGVGRLGIVDHDVVDRTNLQRQVMHGEQDLDRPKVESARDRIHDLNRNVEVITYREPVTSDNLMRILDDGYDLVIDGTDNFPTRYLTNDACVLRGIPNVYGSIFRFEGQATVFLPRDFNGFLPGPCYRCLYPTPPPPGMVPSCAEGGVLGILPGVVGLIQATEAVKLLMGIGEPLVGRLMLYDALEMRFRQLKLKRDPNCPVCGDHPTVTELIDYQEFCGYAGTTNGHAQDAGFQIEPKELKATLDDGQAVTLLDCREPVEWEISQLAGAKFIAMDEVAERVNELDTADNLVVYCRYGIRSAQIVSFLRDLGFAKARNLRGGINAWSREVDSRVPEY